MKTKRSVKITAMLLALIMAFCVLPLTNALAESPEDTLDGFELATGFAITKDVKQDGESAIMYEGSRAGTMVVGNVEVKANTQYLMTAWLRREGATDTAKVTVKGNGVNETIASNTVGEWSYYSVSFDSGENTELVVTATGRGKVYFDAINMKGQSRPAKNLITDGDFENSSAGFAGELSSEQAHSGNQSLKNPGITWGPTVKVEPNTWYIYSAWIWRENGDNWAYIDMNDTEGEAQLRATHDDLIGQWEQVAGLWYSNANSSTPTRIVVENNWDNPYGGYQKPCTIYIDDMTLVKADVGEEILTDSDFTKRGWELSDGMEYTSERFYQSGAYALVAGAQTGMGSGDKAQAVANSGEAASIMTDTDYFVSGWFFRNGGGKSVKGEIQIVDENDNILATFTGTRYNQKNSTYSPGEIVKNADWEYVSGIWNSGGYSRVRVKVVVDGIGTDVTDTMFFDEISFRRAATSTVSDNVLTYNINMFEETLRNERMDGDFELQFDANSTFGGFVLDPEGQTAKEISYELYEWVDSYKRTMQNSPVEKETVELNGEKHIYISFGNKYDAGQYLLKVNYDGEILKYKSDNGVLYTASVNTEKAVPRMQIMFMDEAEAYFSTPVAKTGYEYRYDMNAPTASEKVANKAEYDSYINDLANFPTTMTIGGKDIVGFGNENFTLLSQTSEEDTLNHGTKTTTVLSYNEFTDLVFTIKSEYYPEYAAFDWTIYYENKSATENSPIIKDIRSAHMTMDGAGQYMLTNKGDAGWYAAEEYTIEGMKKVYAPSTGRSTQGAFPYYNLEYGNGGSLIAIGWNGQWEATFNCREEGKTEFIAGQQTFNAYLKPGESMRTPLVAFIRYDGRDTDRATNLWRRWLINCNMRKVTDGPNDTTGEKHLFAPQISGGTSVLYHEMTQATDANQIAAIKWYKDNDIDISFWWMDAGWYYKTTNEDGEGNETGLGESLNDWGWGDTGVWQVDTKRFPSKMKAISEYGESVGVHTLLWFEPERIGNFTYLKTDGSTVHADWVLSGALVDLGRPEAVDWYKKRITRILGEGGIYMYREDYNIAPLGYWRGNDAKKGNENREGITENKYIQGHMELWDYILDMYPYVTIDSCASGGNRNDLETYRRAVALHKTDLNYGDTTGQQGIEYAYNQWMVYYGSKANGDGDHGTEFASKYALRTATCPWMVLGYSTNTTIWNEDGHMEAVGEVPLDKYIIKDGVDQQWATAEYTYADWYALTPLDQTDENWIGWEYYDEAKGSGYALAFRRSRGAAQQVLKLKGLDPAKNYTIYFEDRNDYGTYSGAQLMYEGVLWTLPAGRTSDILWINLATNGVKERDLTVNVTGPSVNTVAQGWTTGEVKAAIYKDNGFYRFAVRLNMALRDTFFTGTDETRLEEVPVAAYGDQITVNGKTLNEIEAEGAGSVKLVYDVDLHILNVYIAINNSVGFAPEEDNAVTVSGLVTEQGVKMAEAIKFDYSKDTQAWTTDTKATSVKITNEETELMVGKSLQLTAKVTPSITSDQVVWTVESGDATITDGVLKINKAGAVVIKATAGEVSDTITIKGVNPVNIKTLKVKLASTLYTYDGKVKTPAVAVTDAKGNKIASTNYTVKYGSGRKLPGTYTVTVTMKGDFTGSKTLTFSIRGKQMAVSKLSALSKGFKATWKKQSYVTGYQVQYSTSSKFTAKTTKHYTINKYTTTYKTVTKLKAKTKYYVRVRSYKTTKIGGKNYNVYSAWSKAKAVTTKK